MKKPSIVESFLAKTAYVLSRARGNRIFHAEGIAMTCRIKMREEYVSTFNLQPQYTGIIRISRGITPRSFLPDILGVALRLNNFKEVEKQDLLFLSAGKGLFTKYIPLPVWDFRTPLFTTILPYKVHGVLHHIGCKVRSESEHVLTLEAMEKNPKIEFDIMLSVEGGTWDVIGTVHCDQRLSQKESKALQFNPWNTSSLLYPFGVIHKLRNRLYKEAQRGRKEKTNA